MYLCTTKILVSYIDFTLHDHPNGSGVAMDQGVWKAELSRSSGLARRASTTRSGRRLREQFWMRAWCMNSSDARDRVRAKRLGGVRNTDARQVPEPAPFGLASNSQGRDNCWRRWGFRRRGESEMRPPDG